MKESAAFSIEESAASIDAALGILQNSSKGWVRRYPEKDDYYFLGTKMPNPVAERLPRSQCEFRVYEQKSLY